MPTLAEMRSWMGGADIEGLPKRNVAWDRTIRVTKEDVVNDERELYPTDPRTPPVLPAVPADFWEPATAGSGYVGVDIDAATTTTKAKTTGVDRSKMKKRVRPTTTSSKFKMTADGDDAVITFGRHAGQKVSELPTEYLAWMVEKDKSDPYPPELMEIVRRHHARRKGSP